MGQVKNLPLAAPAPPDRRKPTTNAARRARSQRQPWAMGELAVRFLLFVQEFS